MFNDTVREVLLHHERRMCCFSYLPPLIPISLFRYAPYSTPELTAFPTPCKCASYLPFPLRPLLYPVTDCLPYPFEVRVSSHHA